MRYVTLKMFVQIQIKCKWQNRTLKNPNQFSKFGLTAQEGYKLRFQSNPQTIKTEIKTKLNRKSEAMNKMSDLPLRN